MRLETWLAASATVVLFPGALAWPGMNKIMAELDAKLLHTRQTDGSDNFDSNELIGDLLTVGATTAVGKQVQGVILGQITPTTDDTYTAPGAKGSKACKADTCCIWSYIANDMRKKFRGGGGRCNGFARAAVRMGFHDAGSWDKWSTHGGADGSLILAGEISRPENNGLQDIISWTQSLYGNYSSYGISMADTIQMAATVAAVVCPLGPRVRSYVGRRDSSVPAPDGLLPSVFASADSLLQLFANKTIKAHGLTALVGAHSTSQQRFVDPSRAYDPQDRTPGVWDVAFYNSTLPGSPNPKRVFKFASDVVLSQHPNVSAEWNKFASGNQDDWNEDYAREYVRLSLLGVNNINSLTECTKVLPPANKTYVIPDKKYIDKWLAGQYPKLGPAVENADLITMDTMSSLGYAT